MSRILLLSLNYAPEPTGFAPHSTALAEHLASQGHVVTVVTGFPFAPRWRRWPEYRGHISQTGTHNGVRLVRLTHFVPRRPGSAVQRAAMEGSFAAAALLAVLFRLFKRDRFDLVIYAGAQPAIAWLARLLASALDIPYVVKITDLATQAAVDVGIVRNRRLASILSRFEFSAYRRASAAIVLCEAFRQALTAQGYPATAVHLIPDSIDLDWIGRIGDAQGLRTQLGLPAGSAVALYSGSFGLKQGLADVIRAAALGAGEIDIRWVLVGEGEARPALEEQVREHDLADRVYLLPLQADDRVAETLAAADILILSQLRSVKDTVIPSKLLMYMAAGRAVLAAVNPGSQAAALVREAGGGLVVEPEDPVAIAKGVKAMLADRNRLNEMAQRNRMYAAEHFDRRVILREQQQLIERVASDRDRQRFVHASAGRQ